MLPAVGAGPNDQDVVDAYWERHRLSTSTVRSERLASEHLAWAADAVDEAIDARGDRAVEMLVALASAATDDDLADLGAGPLEQFFHEPLDDRDIDLIVAAIRQTPGLRAALSHVWWSEVAERVAERVRPLAP
jgi:hypothetical protein